MVIWRGLGGHTFKNVGKMPNIQKCGKDAKQLARSRPNLAHVHMHINLGMDMS